MARWVDGIWNTSDSLRWKQRQRRPMRLFFLRGHQLLRDEGGFGLLATNTISQGDTRSTGLEQLEQSGCSIIRAVPTRPWPGTQAWK